MSSSFIWNFYILLTKQRIFNISINSSSLNVFLSSLSHLSQILERGNVLLQIYDTLGF